MGDVAISIRIMPDSPKTDLMKIKSEISSLARIQDYKIEPLAFGLKALKILLIKPDKGGGTDELEGQIREIEGVGSVEVESVTLL